MEVELCEKIGKIMRRMYRAEEPIFMCYYGRAKEKKRVDTINIVSDAR